MSRIFASHLVAPRFLRWRHVWRRHVSDAGVAASGVHGVVLEEAVLRVAVLEQLHVALAQLVCDGGADAVAPDPDHDPKALPATDRDSA